MRAAMRYPFARLVRSTVLTALSAGLALAGASPAFGAWPDDPSVNLAVADGGGEQVLPKIAGLPAGGCYIGWYDNRSGNYDVRLQRLDAMGNEQWPHNGILVSGHAQDTWVTDWDLICDTDGNCVLAFSDIRSGNLDVQAYKIAPDGLLAWGPDGINLSQDPGFEPTPSICQASDGDYVFAWARWPDLGGGTIQMQRLAPDGTLRYPVGGVSLVSSLTESPIFPDLEPSLEGDVLLMWVRDGAYMGAKNIRLRRFTPSGAPAWPAHVAIFDASSVPMGYAPHILSDGAGGAVCGWHYAPGTMFSSLVQRVSAGGLELFAHNGVAVSTDATRNHIDPATAFNPSTGEIFVFWNERNSSQSQWGIYGQKISAAGARQWGNAGIALQPVNSEYKSYPRAVPLGDGAVCFFTDTPAGFIGDRLVAYRLNASGMNLWPTVPLPVSTARSDKSRLPLFIDGRGTTRIAWEDTRNGAPDIYAQNVRADGALGVDPEGIRGAEIERAISSNYPNPFRESTEFRLNEVASGALVIVGADGRTIRRLSCSVGPQEHLALRWDGRDDRGRLVPAGSYFYRWVGGRGAGSGGKAVIVR